MGNNGAPHDRDILDNVAAGVYFVDHQRRITFWNRAATEISGHAGPAVAGRICAEGPLQHVDLEGRPMCTTSCPLTAVLGDGQPRDAHVLLRHALGHRVPVRVSVRSLRDEGGGIVGAVETFSDETAAIEAKRRVTELEQLAYVDTLTGLGNRRFAEAQLAARMSEIERRGRPVGLLLLDIDHFKRINDTWGHEAGDAALAMIGRTLSGSARAEDCVARWGGEEFVVLVRESSGGDLARIAERVRRLVEGSHVPWLGTTLRLTVSIGGAVATQPGPSAGLVRKADDALYASKNAGRNRSTVAA